MKKGAHEEELFKDCPSLVRGTAILDLFDGPGLTSGFSMSGTGLTHPHSQPGHKATVLDTEQYCRQDRRADGVERGGGWFSLRDLGCATGGGRCLPRMVLGEGAPSAEGGH